MIEIRDCSVDNLTFPIITLNQAQELSKASEEIKRNIAKYREYCEEKMLKQIKEKIEPLVK